MSASRWNATSTEAQLLEKLCKNGDVKQGDTAKVVKSRYPEFQKFKTPNLNQNIKRYIAKFGDPSIAGPSVLAPQTLAAESRRYTKAK